MDEVVDLSLFPYFEDPRDGPALRHLLLDVVVIAICAVICGAGHMGGCGELRVRSVRLAEPVSGVAPWDTPPWHVRAIFALLDAEQFEYCYHAWMNAATQMFRGK